MSTSMGPSQAPARRIPHMRSPAFVQPPSASEIRDQRPASASSSGSSSSSTSTLTSSSTNVNLIKPTRNADGRPHQSQGYFEPSLATPSASAVAAAAALRDSQRKRSMTDPALQTVNSNSSSSTTGSTSSSTVGFGYPAANSSAMAGAMAAMPKTDRNPSISSESTTKGEPKEKKESKMKLFSKPRLTGSSSSSKLVSESASKPIPSPSRTGPPIVRMPTAGSADSSRRPSFTQAFSDQVQYSSSPPTTHSHHKHHLLLRSRKDPALSSANSNSKPSEGGSMYSFAPSSPSSAAFGVGVGSVAGQSQKSLVSAYDLKHVVGVSSKDKDAAVEQVLEDYWPTLKGKVLGLFAGEGLRTPVEDLNKLVVLHIKRRVDSNHAISLIDDTRSVLDQGMTSLDNNLINLKDERLVPRLVEIWNFVFSNVLPYFEAVFLPLQQEFRGTGSVMKPREARECWGVTDERLDIRRMTLVSYRDNIILPLHSRLRVTFSKLQLDFDALPNVTETVGRVLQCVSVLASVLSHDDKQAKMDELAKTLKHNWLSRGRTGRNRRGFVGTKTRVLGSGPTSATGSMIGGVMTES